LEIQRAFNPAASGEHVCDALHEANARCFVFLIRDGADDLCNFHLVFCLPNPVAYLGNAALVVGESGATGCRHSGKVLGIFGANWCGSGAT
jgi:hypothetical protein